VATRGEGAAGAGAGAGAGATVGGAAITGGATGLLGALGRVAAGVVGFGSKVVEGAVGAVGFAPPGTTGDGLSASSVFGAPSAGGSPLRRAYLGGGGGRRRGGASLLTAGLASREGAQASMIRGTRAFATRFSLRPRDPHQRTRSVGERVEELDRQQTHETGQEQAWDQSILEGAWAVERRRTKEARRGPKMAGGGSMRRRGRTRLQSA